MANTSLRAVIAAAGLVAVGIAAGCQTPDTGGAATSTSASLLTTADRGAALAAQGTAVESYQPPGVQAATTPSGSNGFNDGDPTRLWSFTASSDAAAMSAATAIRDQAIAQGWTMVSQTTATVDGGPQMTIELSNDTKDGIVQLVIYAKSLATAQAGGATTAGVQVVTKLTD